EPQGSGILGNTSRPEAESVAVYTRSGRPVGTNAGGPVQQDNQARNTSRSSSSYSSYRRNRDDYEDGFDDYTPSSRPMTPIKEYNASGQLPPYILRADSYEDVQTVVRRVRTNQPVMLVLNDTPSEDAQRILDFCFGLSFGIDGEVQPVEGGVFLVLPAGIQVSPSEVDRLLAQVN
ncbi:MAG: cell division protein SepF, partial [Coriobacteriales bacterium]|nr:cell division protein SepF [Coriobacteriales bacterium]